MWVACALSTWAQGVVTWSETTHDFGNFKEELKTVKCVMPFLNTGDSAIMITRVQPTCGCTAAHFTHGVIMPGERGQIDISYDARNIPGPFSKKIFVYTTGKPHKSVLTIKGNVIGAPETVKDKYPYAVGPVRLNHESLPLGEMYRGKARNAYLSGYNTSTDTMLVGVNHTPRHIAAHVLPDTVTPGGVFIVSVNYESGFAREWGFNVDTLALMATPLHGSPSLSASGLLYVMAQVKEDFSKLSDKEKRNAPVATFSTDKVDFGTMTQDTTTERLLTIRNEGKNKLAIRRLFVPEGEGVTVHCGKTELKKGEETTIALIVDSNKVKDKVLNSQLTIITNDPYTPQSTVRLVGQVINNENSSKKQQ